MSSDVITSNAVGEWLAAQRRWSFEQALAIRGEGCPYPSILELAKVIYQDVFLVAW